MTGPVRWPVSASGRRFPFPILSSCSASCVAGKLVDSVRGPGGGYCIARPAGVVTVADIIRAVDEPLDATQCGGRENCHDEHRCMTHDLWST
jgi:Rrf2 family iron-sulfur cluster assembly transcriptional regulator